VSVFEGSSWRLSSSQPVPSTLTRAMAATCPATGPVQEMRSEAGSLRGRSARKRMTNARQRWKYWMVRSWGLMSPARSPSPAGTASSLALSHRAPPFESELHQSSSGSLGECSDATTMADLTPEGQITCPARLPARFLVLRLGSERVYTFLCNKKGGSLCNIACNLVPAGESHFQSLRKEDKKSE
jgi:hypothetical protein